MGMRIGAAHYSASILQFDSKVESKCDTTRLNRTHLKDLYISNAILTSSPDVDLDPLLDNPVDILQGKSCKGQIVPPMEDQDIASPTSRLHGHQRVDRGRCDGNWGWQHGGIIVLENIGLLIVVVYQTPRPLVAGTQIAAWVVLWVTTGLRSFILAIPGTFGAMR